MSRGYSVAQTARLVCALRWTCGRLSEVLEGWAAQAAVSAEHAGAAADMAELSRRLASHRGSLDGLQPDSELMAPWREAAPGDGSLAAALDEIAALEGSLERLDIARKVLVPQLLSAYAETCDHAAPHCDGALASAARWLGHDLDLYSREDDAAPDGTAQQEGLAEAERALDAAGGIVGASLLRPDDWP